jgi:acyl dehydratase
MTAELSHPKELLTLIGSDLGTSGWHELTQERVNLFADATGDQQWIHTDPIRASSGPFGAVVAHGFLTLSLFPVILAEALTVEHASVLINYGLNRVRFPTPVPVGSRVRGSLTLSSAQTRPNGMIEAVFDVTFELEGSDRPACTAQAIVLYG